MYNKNSKSPNTEPCGTPYVISKVSEILPQTDTIQAVFCRVWIFPSAWGLAGQGLSKFQIFILQAGNLAI